MVVCTSGKTSYNGGGSRDAHACRATARNGLDGCMHEVFREAHRAAERGWRGPGSSDGVGDAWEHKMRWRPESD
uniref:Uncharacterized protein n=1 Tax=Leersia perrieri TaxID=77586 RepID=A0A0D9V1S7_9ORYZ